MTQAPATKTVQVIVDLVGCERFFFTVRHRADGSEHVLAYDGVEIGANEAGDGYTLILPRSLAEMQGLA